MADLQIVEEQGRRSVAAVVRETGRAAAEVLGEALPDCIAGITFDRSMRWNASNLAYSRPLRWLLALYGPQQVPFSYAGIDSGRCSRGLRPYGSPAMVITDAGAYAPVMEASGVVTDPEARRALIRSVAAEMAARCGGVWQEDTDLLDEVTHLIERPDAVLRALRDAFPGTAVRGARSGHEEAPALFPGVCRGRPPAAALHRCAQRRRGTSGHRDCRERARPAGRGLAMPNISTARTPGRP